jgi:hypothetical protein
VSLALPEYDAAETSTAEKEVVQEVYLALTVTHSGRFLQSQNHKELGKEDAMVRLTAMFESMGRLWVRHCQNQPTDDSVLIATLIAEFLASESIFMMDPGKPTGRLAVA